MPAMQRCAASSKKTSRTPSSGIPIAIRVRRGSRISWKTQMTSGPRTTLGWSSWSVLAHIGHHHLRYIDNTREGCNRWAEKMRGLDWQVGDPEPWPGYGETFTLEYSERSAA